MPAASKSEPSQYQRNALAPAILAAAACLIASSWGVASLSVAGIVRADQFLDSWQTWWLGDLIGIPMESPEPGNLGDMLLRGLMDIPELATDALGLPAPAMSRHLRLMKQSGLVQETHPEFDARVRVYALKDGAMADLKSWVAETEAMWTAQLSAFKIHVEKKRR